MKDDVTISLEADKLHIREIARKYDIFESELEPFGKWVAKIESSVYDRLKDKKNANANAAILWFVFFLYY